MTSENPEKSSIVNIEEFEALKKELELLKLSKEADGPIEKPKRPKREQTEKQKEQFQKALIARQENIRIRAEAKAKLEEQARKEAEEDLIKKAIKYKKQQIKKIQVELPDIESEEEDDESAPIQKPPAPAPSKKEPEKINVKQLPPRKEKSKYIFI
jgi:hypothetical protein